MGMMRFDSARGPKIIHNGPLNQNLTTTNVWARVHLGLLIADLRAERSAKVCVLFNLYLTRLGLSVNP